MGVKGTGEEDPGEEGERGGGGRWAWAHGLRHGP